jgi:hypothetical protein
VGFASGLVVGERQTARKCDNRRRRIGESLFCRFLCRKDLPSLSVNRIIRRLFVTPSIISIRKFFVY